MKFGFVISLWVLLCPLFSQNCEEVEIGPVHYFEESESGSLVLESYFVPCKETTEISYTLSSAENQVLDDPDIDGRIILVLLKSDPGRDVITVTEFLHLLVLDIDNHPVYFSDPSSTIQISDLTGLGNGNNDFVLMPVLVPHITASDPSQWFEGGCVFINSAYSLTIIENPVNAYEFPHFDEITFTNWPEEVPITDYFDFTFTDQETDQNISYTATDNRSFRLEFQKPEGIFRFGITWKNHDCEILELGINWKFPTIGMKMDTVSGYRNIEKCVPVRVFNFESVTSFEFSMDWDVNSLDFTAIQNIHPDLELYLKIGDIITSTDRYRINIELPTGSEPISLPDSTVIFEWCGKALSESGQYVEMGFSSEENDSESHFTIHDLESSHEMVPGGIEVQEDRELIYDLNQLCKTRDGRHRVQLDIINDEAYPYTYSFHSPFIPDSVVKSTPFIIPNAPPGQYEFTIRDSFGFEITETFNVNENVPPGFDMEIDPSLVRHPTCLNPFGGQIGITIGPADQTYKLNLLNDEADFVDNYAAGLVAGDYIIEAEDESGCVDTMHYTLRNPREINITWNEADLVLCPGDQEVILKVLDVSSIPDASIEFQVEGGTTTTLGESIALYEAGEFPVQFWNRDGCVLDTMVVVRSAPEQMGVWDTTNVMINLGDTLAFTGPQPEGLSKTIWEYSGHRIGDGYDVRYSPEQSGTLYYSASVYEKCMYSDSLMVQVLIPDQGPLDFDFPNVFSPNGDGVNDVFVIIPTREIQKVRRMEVYDRYGNFIFKKDYSEDRDVVPLGWDGRQSGVESPSGVYAVQLEVQLYDGRTEQMGIDVLLIR